MPTLALTLLNAVLTTKTRGASNLKLEKDLEIAPKPEQVNQSSNESLLVASNL